MSAATPEQVAMARRIADTVCGITPEDRGRMPAFENNAMIAALAAIIETSEAAAKLVEELHFSGGTLSSWINVNESPMGATRRHIATALRNGEHLKDIDRLAGEVR